MCKPSLFSNEQMPEEDSTLPPLEGKVLVTYLQNTFRLW